MDDIPGVPCFANEVVGRAPVVMFGEEVGCADECWGRRGCGLWVPFRCRDVGENWIVCHRVSRAVGDGGRVVVSEGGYGKGEEDEGMSVIKTCKV